MTFTFSKTIIGCVRLCQHFNTDTLTIYQAQLPLIHGTQPRFAIRIMHDCICSIHLWLKLGIKPPCYRPVSSVSMTQTCLIDAYSCTYAILVAAMHLLPTQTRLYNRVYSWLCTSVTLYARQFLAFLVLVARVQYPQSHPYWSLAA